MKCYCGELVRRSIYLKREGRTVYKCPACSKQLVELLNEHSLGYEIGIIQHTKRERYPERYK